MKISLKVEHDNGTKSSQSVEARVRPGSLESEEVEHYGKELLERAVNEARINEEKQSE